MGVLTDFVIADAGAAEIIGASSCPYEDFEGIDAKGIDTVKMGTLYGLLTGLPLDSNTMYHAKPIVSVSENGPWVLVVPSDLVSRLGKLSAEELNHLGGEWAKTEEFSPKYGNWTREAITEVLEELATLCRKAIEKNKAVFMWISL